MGGADRMAQITCFVGLDVHAAERLARLLAAGELPFVRFPSVAEGQLRDRVRAREDLRGDLNRVRQRLSHFLRRRRLRFTGPGNNWTHAHRAWLRALEFSDPASEVTFADYQAAVDAICQRRDTVDATLEQLAPESPWAQTIARLRCFRGIDTLAAVGLCAEIGDFERFRHPRQLGAFLGLVPSGREAPPGPDHKGRPKARARGGGGGGKTPLARAAAPRAAARPPARPG